VEWLVARDMEDRLAGAIPFLMGFARVLGGHYYLRAARRGGASHARLARFYITRLLPEHAGHLAAARAGAADLMALTLDDLGA
jgi:hypothetical protein